MSKRPKLLLQELDLVDAECCPMSRAIPPNTLQRHGSLEAPLKNSLFAQCSSSRNKLNMSERLSLIRKESEREFSQNYDTSQCSDDYMTPSDQPIVQKTNQQLQDQISSHRISTLSRIDPTKSTAFDSFSTIVQEFPKDLRFPVVNPFLGSRHLNFVKNGKISHNSVHGDSRLSREFDCIESIGRGSFGEVYRARLIVDGTFYAVKKLKHTLPRVSGTNALLSLLKEIHCLAFLSQQAPECMNIVRYYSSWVDPSDQSIYIQTEYCSEGSLAQRYVSYPNNPNYELIQEEHLVEIIRQVCIGLHTMHRIGIVHLDLKPDNLLQNGHGVIKISDFGLCAQMCQYQGRTISEGDARYLADELLNDNYQHLDRVDMFALGATLLELCRGTPLPTQGLEYHQIRLGQVQLPDRFSAKLAHLVRSLLSAEPTSRPSALEVLTILSSPSCALPSTVRDLSERLQCALKRVAVLEKELYIANERARSSP